MFYVYEILNLVNGKRYIGKAANVKARWREHLRIAKSLLDNSFIIHRAIAKYKPENFQFKILFEFENEQDALNKEIELISYYKTNIHKYGNDYGYNLTDGGDGVSGRVLSEESRQKISVARQGIIFSDETLEKMRQAKLGRKHTMEHIEKQRLASLNKKRAAETIEKVSVAMTGENNHQAKLDEENIKEIKIMLANNKSVAIIAPLYKVARKTISDIKHGKTWVHIKLTESDIANTSQILLKLGNAQNPIKLNKEKASEIRELLSNGIEPKIIAKQFGVSKTTIMDIKNNRYWNDTPINKITASKLTEGQVREIKQLLEENKLSYAQIARQFNVAPGTINKIKRGFHWNNF